MPVSLPPLEKSAFIAIVNVYNPIEADRLQTVLLTYDDIIIAVGRQLNVLAANKQLLTELMNCFSSMNSLTQLLAAGIIYNLTNGTMYNNPKLIINSTLTGGIMLSANSVGLGIINSTVSSVALGSNAVLDNLYVAGGVLALLDSRSTLACVTRIYLPFLNNRAASITEVAKDSCIGAVKVDPGSSYGGTGNVIPIPTCGNPVTTLATNDITYNSIRLSWVPPANFLFINVTYRKVGSGAWIGVKPLDGDYIESTGYVFRDLEADTNYEFQVIVTCTNGGYSAPVAVTGKTVCCG